jgi:CRP/FNR family transcriptional regulator, anaerobic regulatory protein
MLTSAHQAEVVTVPFRRPTVAAVAPSRLEACFADAPSRQLKSNQPLFAEGDGKTNAYKVESGAVLIYKLLSDGTRQIVSFAFPGDIIGLEAGDEHACDAQTLAVTRIRSVPVSALWRGAASDPVLAKELFQSLSREITDARDHLLTIGRLCATGRIATFLLSLVRRAERKGLDTTNIFLPVRRSDIADFLCLSVETVSRSLTELKISHVISLRGWRQIRIQDRAMLERLASGEVHIDGDKHLRKAA